MRSRIKKEGVENHILLVEYSLNSLTWHHVAGIFALEEGSLASYESLNSLANFSRGSASLGISDPDATGIADRLPRQCGVPVQEAKWINDLTYESTKAGFPTVPE